MINIQDDEGEVYIFSVVYLDIELGSYCDRFMAFQLGMHFMHVSKEYIPQTLEHWCMISDETCNNNVRFCVFYIHCMMTILTWIQILIKKRLIRLFDDKEKRCVSMSLINGEKKYVFSQWQAVQLSQHHNQLMGSGKNNSPESDYRKTNELQARISRAIQKSPSVNKTREGSFYQIVGLFTVKGMSLCHSYTFAIKIFQTFTPSYIYFLR